MNSKPIDTMEDTQAQSSPQARVASYLAMARALQRGVEAEVTSALAALEEAMAVARATPFEIEFRTRVELGLALGDAYVVMNDFERARLVLGEEADFTEKIFQIMQATGTQEQKRAAAGGRVQVRDRARQVKLIGEPAPEIAIGDWINGEPTTLAELRGRVVLLEFWATWCKPCQEMFPKLRQLDEQHRKRGLDVIALTRHYFARRETASSQEEELDLMRSLILKHDLSFRVGVAEDERTQEVYGATGMPALALIDRAGVVRYAHFGGGDDARFDSLLAQSLDQKAPE